MKTILPLLFSLLHFVSFAGVKESWPQYKVICSEINTALNENEAEYFFYSPELQTLYYGMEVSYSVDDKIGTALLDKQGTFVIKTTPGKHVMQLYIRDHDEIYLDSIEVKAKHRTTIELYWRYTEYQITADKPVIYLYPKTKTNVTVSLETVGELTYVYPPFNKDNAWYVTASPDGILGQYSDAQYRYLFWESQQEFSSMPDLYNQGFYTTPASSMGLLEYICNEFGLTSIEKADFITYWGPQIQQMENCFIRILFNEEVDRIATLNIEPKPDHIYRIFLLIKSDPEMDEMMSVQYIPKMKRDGFTVIEWGGTIIGNMTTEKL